MDVNVTLPVPVAGVGYDTDFYAWTQDQGHMLRAGCFSELDLSNLAEEIESIGRSEKRELTNRLVVLLAHMLKWATQPARRSRSWTNTIREHRDQAELLLRDSPSLRPLLTEIVADAHGSAAARRSVRPIWWPAASQRPVHGTTSKCSTKHSCQSRSGLLENRIWVRLYYRFALIGSPAAPRSSHNHPMTHPPRSAKRPP